jgi:hypothetical protein
MKAVRYFTLIFLLGLGADLFAQEATVTYVDGWVDIKNKSGNLIEAWEGDSLYIGESIITDEASYAELEKEQRAAVIKVAPDTVFTIGEVEEKGRAQTVLSTTLGSVAYKFGRTLAREPRISTPSVVGGVRGTEFTVFAGVDGSSLIAVESGEVEITSEGETVRLLPQEGVEVRPGEKPGEKFTVLRGQIDYSTWNRQRFDAFLDDPVGTMKRVEKRLETFLAELDALVPLYNKLRKELVEKRKEWEKIRDEEGREPAEPYYVENIEPIQKQTAPLFINIRYYSLSALSLRRYIAGRLYMEMKTRYIGNTGDDVFIAFIDVYNEFLEKFEKNITQHLVDADI